MKIVFLFCLILQSCITLASEITPNPDICQQAAASIAPELKLRVLVGGDHQIYKSASIDCSRGNTIIKTDGIDLVLVGQVGNKLFSVYRLNVEKE